MHQHKRCANAQRGVDASDSNDAQNDFVHSVRTAHSESVV